MDTRDFDLAVGAKTRKLNKQWRAAVGRGGETITKAAFAKKKPHSFLTVIFSPQLFEWPVENVYGRQQQHFITYERNKQSNLAAFNA